MNHIALFQRYDPYRPWQAVVCDGTGPSLSLCEAFYLATLGGARALSMDDQTGNLQAGKEADFIF